MTSIGIDTRIAAVGLAIVALIGLTLVAPQKVLIPLGVVFVTGLAASALISLVGRYPRVVAAQPTTSNAPLRGAAQLPL